MKHTRFILGEEIQDKLVLGAEIAAGIVKRVVLNVEFNLSVSVSLTQYSFIISQVLK